ncbi:MAG: DNA polymerase III subunit beta [Ruminococcus sp.]|nr:DNA polymerase III subunit beta [Ruminococcus sp.]
MKFNCMRSELTKAVLSVSRAVSAKSSQPALEGVLIKAYDSVLSLTGYDLEIGITTNIGASIEEQGEVVVSAKLFSDIIRNLPEEIVSIETDERLITTINSGSSEYQIVGISSAEYPELPRVDELEKIKIDAAVLKDMIRETVFAVSDNMSKPIYTGSLFDIDPGVLRIVAIDGFRMAIREEQVESELNTKFVVPSKTQQEIIRLISDEEQVEMIVGSRHITFKIDNYTVISRLIEGTFLDYKTTVPQKCTTEFKINKRLLSSAVERMLPMTGEKIQSPVRANVTADEIKLSCTTTVGRATDSLPVSAIGNEVVIGFNNRYMLDALKNADTDEVKIEMSGSLSPIIIKPVEGNNFLYLVVPMRLSAES